MRENSTRTGLNSQDWLYLGLLLLVILSIAFLLPVEPNDYWWYVRIGGDTLNAGAIPTIDTLSYTQAGQPVVYHSWFSAILFALLNKLGGISLTVLVRGLALALGYGTIFVAARQSGAGLKTTSLVTLLAILATSNNWSVRPQMFTYVLFAAVVLILLRWTRHWGTRSIWLLPLISLLWVNLHGSFVMLFLLIGATLVFGKGDRRTLAIALGLSLLTSLLNPRGLGAWQYVLQSLTTPSSQSFSMEWSPPLNVGWQMQLFFGWLLLFMPLLAITPRKLTVLEWAWLLGFGWLALSGQRYVIWFVFILSILSASLLTSLLEGLNTRRQSKPAQVGIKAANISLGILFTLLPLALLPGLRAAWWADSPGPLMDTPVQAVDWLEDNPSIPGPLWSEIGYSSYLEYALPSRPVWNDTRFEVYPTEQWERYEAVNSGDWKWQTILDEEGVNLLLVSKSKQADLLAALQTAPGWVEMYADKEAVIFKRGGKNNMRLTWKREWAWILIAMLTLRVLYSVIGVMTISDGLPEALGPGESMFSAVAPLRTDGISQALVNVWMRWDTAWYLKIAASGYAANDASIAFMPLYPLLIKGAGFLLGGNLLLGAILVSNLAAFIAMILLFELALKEFRSKTKAMQTVLAILLFPTGFFLFAAYTESLFLLLVLAAWLCALRKNWWAAGIFAGLATFSRIQGALLSPVIIWLYLVSSANAEGLNPLDQVKSVWNLLTTSSGWKKAKISLLQPAWFAFLIPVTVALGFVTWLKISNLGNYSQILLKSWGIHTVMPWEGFRLFLVRLFNEPRVFIDYIDLGAMLLMLAVCIYVTIRFDPAYSIFLWVNLSMYFLQGNPPHLLDSFSRFFLKLFPAFLVFGAIKNRRLVLAFGILSFIVQLFLVMGFLDWRWVA